MLLRNSSSGQRKQIRAVYARYFGKHSRVAGSHNSVQCIGYNQRVGAGKRNVKSYKILSQSLCPLLALDLLASFDSVNLVTSELKHYLTQVSRSLGIKKVCISLM
jgi:hypothetical protein